MKNKKLLKSLGGITSGVTALVLGCIGIYLFYQYHSVTNEVRQRTFDEARQQTQKVAEKLDSIVGDLIPYVHKIADILSSRQLSEQEAIALLNDKPVSINGIGFGYLPYKFDSSKRLFAPFLVEKGGKDVLEAIEKDYDYTDKKYHWFHEPLEKGAGFLEPYYGPVSKTIIAEYSAPIYDPKEIGKKDRKPIGIVFGSQSIRHLNYILSRLYKGTSSYWYIISKKGTIIAHPRSQWVLDQKTIYDLAEELKYKALGDIGKKAIETKDVQWMEYRNEVSGQKSWLFTAAMPKTGWVIFQAYNKGEIPYDWDDLRQRLFIITICFTLMSLCFVTLALFSMKISDSVLALGSALVTCILCSCIALLWTITYIYPYLPNLTRMIKNKQDLFTALKEEKKKYKLLDESKQEKKEELGQIKNKEYVPTGIYIDNFILVKENIELHGFVWQHYVDSLHEGIERGFIFPRAYKSNVKEISRRKTKDGETIVWEVTATIDQDLDFSRYPFDAKALTIELWHKEFNKEITLVPDFDSYSPLIPQSLPGLPEKPELSGWHINKTFFGYQLVYPNTYFGMYSYGNFGIYEYIDKSATPKLYFNILIQRNLSEIFISSVIPVVVIALLLFIILLTEMQAGGVFKFAGIFFSIVVAQNQLRSKIATDVLVYFEWFYMMLYVTLIIIGLIALVSKLKIRIRILEYKDNFIPKLLFWPLFLLGIVVITVFYLY